MANLQVKRLPEELHQALRRRAADEGLSQSELVTRMLRRELAVPSMSQWLATIRARPVRSTDIDVPTLLDDVRSANDQG